LEKVEGTGGAGLLGCGVGYYGGETVDWALLSGSVSQRGGGVGWDGWKTCEYDDATPAEAVVEADGEDLGEDDGRGEIVELCLRD